MKRLTLALAVCIVFLIGASFASAQTQIEVIEFNNTSSQYSDEFIVKLTVDGNSGLTYRGSSLTSVLGHAEVYWLFPIPTNNGQVMVTANVIPGYQFGNPDFVPYDPAGAFCSLTINPSTQTVVGLLVTEDASGPHCSMQ